jgi:transcriptional regulator with XRE-family HTH domain
MADWETAARAYLNAHLEPRGAQAALARQLTIHDQAWLSRYLAGAFSMDLGTLQEICATLNVHVSEVIGGTAPPPMTDAQREALEVSARWPRVPDSVRLELLALIRSLAPDTARERGGQSNPADRREDKETRRGRPSRIG